MKFNQTELKINRLGIAVLIALIICVATSIIGFEAKCDDLRNNVLRLHILANSDNEYDQKLKLAVRDAILQSDTVDFDCCTNLEQAKTQAKESINKISRIAKETIEEKGYNYSVTVEVDKSYFDTREYDDFTMPAGVYDALIVKIGKAEGKNWWCVMFPALCLPTSDCENLNDYVEEDSAEIALQPQKFQIRFKTVEIYQHIKKIISKM